MTTDFMIHVQRALRVAEAETRAHQTPTVAGYIPAKQMGLANPVLREAHPLRHARRTLLNAVRVFVALDWCVPTMVSAVGGACALPEGPRAMTRPAPRTSRAVRPERPARTPTATVIRRVKAAQHRPILVEHMPSTVLPANLEDRFRLASTTPAIRAG